MANQFDDNDDDNDFGQEQNPAVPADLRKALKREQKEKKALLEELQQFKSAQREQSVKSVLESEGVNTKVAKFIPDNVTTPEQVKAWIAEYADVFGLSKTDPAAETEEKNPSADAVQRMNNATQTAQNAPGKIEDQMRAVANATSRADLDKLTGNIPDRFQRN